MLQATSENEIECHGIRATRLFTHTEDVNQINERELNNLQGSSRRFTAEDSTTNSSGEEYLNSMCPVPKTLELKLGAQVMLVKNTHIQEGLVNGARGVVTKFDAAHNCKYSTACLVYHYQGTCLLQALSSLDRISLAGRDILFSGPPDTHKSLHTTYIQTQNGLIQRGSTSPPIIQMGNIEQLDYMRSYAHWLYSSNTRGTH